jgi:hypothetical protein
MPDMGYKDPSNYLNVNDDSAHQFIARKEIIQQKQTMSIMKDEKCQ